MGQVIIPILVTGARSWENEQPIERDLRRLVAKYGMARLLLVEGGATGVDTIAGRVGRSLGIHVAEVKALWDTYHRPAGVYRNELVLSFFEPKLVLAYHWDLGDSRGTADCVRRARKKGIKVVYRKIDRRVALTSVDDWHRQKEERQAKRRKAKK